MFSLCRNSFLLSFVFVSTLVQAKESFRICAEPDNLPMSQESTKSGFEIEVAQILAREMNAELEVKWIPQRDHSFLRQTIGTGQCDAIMGVPKDFPKLTTSNSWYSSGYVFVT